MKRRLGGLLLLLAALAACTDDVENEFTSMRAFFRFTQVATAAPLFTALNNPGQFCTVTYSNDTYYIFSDAAGNSYAYTLTELDKRTKPEFVSGLVVGMPAVPDLSGNFPVVCYDLVCPNCYAEDVITRRLSFSGATEMACGRCHRCYDLNNGGIVTEGDKGRKLFRYRATYSNASNTFVVQN